MQNNYDVPNIFAPKQMMGADPGPRRHPLPIPMVRPLVVYGLTAINVLLFVITTIYANLHYGTPLLTALLGDGLGVGLALRDLGGQASVAIAAGEWWRIATAMFLHAGIIHLLFNSWALIVLGGEAESLFGRARFLFYYLLSGLAGSIASLLFNHPELSVGASGAIFGAIGLLAGYYWRHRANLGSAGRARLFNIVLVIILNMALSLNVARIDNWAHTGGLVAGLLFGLLLAPSYAVAEDGSKQQRVISRVQPVLQAATVVGMVIVLAGLFSVALGNLPG